MVNKKFIIILLLSIAILFILLDYYKTEEKFSTVNSKFGSRFNIYNLFEHNKIDTGTLGRDLDNNDNNLIIAIRTGEGIKMLPLADEFYDYDKIKVDLGLTYEKIHSEKTGLEIKTVSPFYPSKNFDEDVLKMNTAPFLYKIIKIYNPTNKLKSGQMLIALNNATSWKTGDSYKIIYYKDSNKENLNGIRAIAITNPESYEISQDIFNNFKSKGYLENKIFPDNFGGFTFDFELKPGQEIEKVIVYAGYNDNEIFTDEKENLKFKFYYTKFFNNVDEIIAYAFEDYDNTIKRTNEFESKLINSNCDDKAKWVIAQAFHSYIANTWLLYNARNNKTRFYVWEGCCSCCYWLSTVDVAHEYGVFEGYEIPWALKLELEEWTNNIAEDSFGKYVQHDLGDKLTIKEYSDYPIRMPVEENANYILLLYWYWKQTKDDSFVKGKIPIIKELVKSLNNRDTNANGIVDVGVGWTTYDSISEVLRSSPDNTYLGIKEMAAFIATKEIFDYFEENSEYVYFKAKLIKDSLVETYNKYGYIPISLDINFEDCNALTPVLGEGLLYLILTDTKSDLVDELIPVLNLHYSKAYEKCKERLICGDSLNKRYNNFPYIWDLNHETIWLSKIMVEDIISNKKFDYKTNSLDYIYDLLRNDIYLYSDAYSNNKNLGLNVYPRGIISYILLKNESGCF